MQDMFSCCGWFNSTTDPFTQSNFCTQAVAANISTTPCVGPVTAVTDYTLNNIFTSIYAFMAPIAALFLATLCVINMVSPTSCGWLDEQVADARRSAPRRSGSRRLTRSAGAPSSECRRYSRPGPPSAYMLSSLVWTLSPLHLLPVICPLGWIRYAFGPLAHLCQHLHTCIFVESSSINEDELHKMLYECVSDFDVISSGAQPPLTSLLFFHHVGCGRAV
jgi:hypothetical protein